MSEVSEWRDNLNIGLYLAGQPHGAPLDQVLTNALGYNPRAPYPQSHRERYVRRLHQAQRMGEEKYAARIPGYFTIKAQPFGAIFLYRALWYIWVNPASGTAQAVPVAATDLAGVRRFNDRYMATRERTTRNVRTADNVQRQRSAIAANDTSAVYAIQSQMVTDGTLSELLTSQLGLPYAELPPVLDGIAAGNRFGTIQLSLSRTAQKLWRLERDLQQEQAKIVRELGTWITMMTGLPSDARRLALQDAQRRLAQLP